MARPRTLAELEMEAFDWGCELKHCMTATWCGRCPTADTDKCPANGKGHRPEAQLEQLFLDIWPAVEVPYEEQEAA